jgi:hypothetical protein
MAGLRGASGMPGRRAGDLSQDRHAVQQVRDNSVKTRALVRAHAVWCGTIDG